MALLKKNHGSRERYTGLSDAGVIPGMRFKIIKLAGYVNLHG